MADVANPMPAAEAEITADLVRRLLTAQHPDLAGLPAEPLSSGWEVALAVPGWDGPPARPSPPPPGASELATSGPAGLARKPPTRLYHYSPGFLKSHEPLGGPPLGSHKGDIFALTGPFSMITNGF
jgi:hypothetical protein